jgi:hypothetical protein
VNAEGLMENSGGRGLPEKLPAGERVLWQGSPKWKTLFRHAFHARAVGIYFGAIIVWGVLVAVHRGMGPSAVALSTVKMIGLSLVPLAMMALYSWALQRSTIYTITSRRVVMSFGLVVPMTFNLPFSRIESAGLKTYVDGSGDLPLKLMPTEKMAYFMVWPHARPWRMARAEPMLRCIPDVGTAAAVLARALSAHAAVTTAFAASAAPARPGDLIPAYRGQAAQAA